MIRALSGIVRTISNTISPFAAAVAQHVTMDRKVRKDTCDHGYWQCVRAIRKDTHGGEAANASAPGSLIWTAKNFDHQTSQGHGVRLQRGALAPIPLEEVPQRSTGVEWH